jgi:hypothetical protein
MNNLLTPRALKNESFAGKLSDLPHSDASKITGDQNTEAMKLLYELAFERLGLRRVWGIVASHNRRMVKWQTYLGMTREGCLRQHLFINGQVQDAIAFGLLADDYRRTTLPRLESLIAAARLPVASTHPSE